MSDLLTDRATMTRVVGYVGVSTLFLTAMFYGIVAVITGSVTAFEQRLPVYVLVAAIAFVVVVVMLEDEDAPGTPILAGTVVVGVMAFVGVSLSGEGLLYALANREAVVSSQLFFYVLAAGLICTGIGYWAVHHWREFAEVDASGDARPGADE